MLKKNNLYKNELYMKSEFYMILKVIQIYIICLFYLFDKLFDLYF